MNAHRLVVIWLANILPLETQMDSNLGQSGIVERTESIEAFCIYLGCAIATHEPIFKKDTNFGHHGMPFFIAGCGYLKSREQVVLSISAHGANGELRASKDHGLLKIFKHIAKRTGGICHRICTVKNNEAIVTCIVFINYTG